MNDLACVLKLFLSYMSLSQMRVSCLTIDPPMGKVKGGNLEQDGNLEQGQ